MSAAVHRSERHGSINWGRRGEGRRRYITVSEELASEKLAEWSVKVKAHTPSPQDQWRNLWHLSCWLTWQRCWQGLWKDSVGKRKRNFLKTLLFHIVLEVTDRLDLAHHEGVRFLTLKLASISLKALVFPLRAVQTRLDRVQGMKRENVN